MHPTGVPACAAGVPFLRELPAAALAELTRQMRHRDLARGEVAAHAGDPIYHLLVVARGRLHAVRSTAQGREQVVRVLTAGDFLGELALFAGAHYDADLVAIEPSTVCLLARDAVQRLLTSQPGLAVGLVEALARRLAAAEEAIAGLALKAVEARLAAELLALAPAGVSASAGVRVRVPTPWTLVASRLGTTPESLSRRLRALERRGVIRLLGSRTVAIDDVEQLRRIAES